jgi:AmiR/NasT family two-component response regulator
VLLCGGKRREIDCAVPRDKPVVAISTKEGESEDRAKRIKEFAAELKEAKECGVKHFVVVYFVLEHEKERLEEIRTKFMREAPFDLVVLTREELESLAEKLREWGVPGYV